MPGRAAGPAAPRLPADAPRAAGLAGRGRRGVARPRRPGRHRTATASSTTLEERVAGLLGTEAAAFFPTGTMAQQVALRCWAGRTGNPTVALHPLAHPEVPRARRVQRGSADCAPSTRRPSRGCPTAEEVRDFAEPFGALMLELPLRDAGFVLPTWEELTAVVEAARERDAVVHFDGARLWECTAALRPPPGRDRRPRGQRLRVVLQVARRPRRRGARRAQDARRGGEDLAAPVRRHALPAVPGGAVRPGRPGAGAAPAARRTWPTRAWSPRRCARGSPRPGCRGSGSTRRCRTPTSSRSGCRTPRTSSTEAAVLQAEETGTCLFRQWLGRGRSGALAHRGHGGRARAWSGRPRTCRRPSRTSWRCVPGEPPPRTPDRRSLTGVRHGLEVSSPPRRGAGGSGGPGRPGYGRAPGGRRRPRGSGGSRAARGRAPVVDARRRRGGLPVQGGAVDIQCVLLIDAHDVPLTGLLIVTS